MCHNTLYMYYLFPGDDWVCKSMLEGAHQRTIRAVTWSLCGNYLATASFDGTVCVWDKKDGEFECMTTLEGNHQWNIIIISDWFILKLTFKPID